MDYKLWIGGRWVDSTGGKTMTVEDPATGQPLAQVIDASRDDVDRAVQAAHEAFYDGRSSRLTPGERSLAIWRLADLLDKRAAEFARAASRNSGKPFDFVSPAASLP